jgi:hypothetical protein
MTVGFDPRTASIAFNTKPLAINPWVAPDTPHAITSLDDFLDDIRILIEGNKVWFASTSIQATGTVNLTGAAGDNASNWELGFLQVQRIETNWGGYKADWTNGAAMKGGSMLLQRGKPPARPRQGCRDSIHAAAAIWYNRNRPTPQNMRGNAGPFPQTLTALFFDQPGEVYPAVVLNTKTNQDNFLRDVQLEFHFCTVLALREPGGRFHLLKHFYWNLLWQATFQPVNFANARHGAWLPPVVLPDGTSNKKPHVSAVFDGAPDREPFRSILTSTTETQTCNDVAGASATSVLTPPFIGRREHVNRDYPHDVRV